jgi:hypothetical protein
VIGALAAPLTKWASKNSKDYGVGAEWHRMIFLHFTLPA